MNTSNRTIRAARKAKAMRLQRWNKVPYTFSKWHYMGAKGNPRLVMSQRRTARFGSAIEGLASLIADGLDDQRAVA
jgi:hypothetical protein